MCGIAGLVDAGVPPQQRVEAVDRMCAAMAHRGPDDGGVASMGACTLGMRRLAIFDPAHGHQPMRSPDGRFTLVFNGAIYNFRDLRRELAGSHGTFRTECDTEVLLAAFVRWGAECLNRLRGMFAFAVWDTTEQSLFLARDPFGIKPLYYRPDGRRLLFGSELNALVSAGVFDAEIDPIAVGDYLSWLAVPAPRTIYRGVSSLRPGEYATWRDGRLSVHTAWTFRGIPDQGAVCRTRTQFVGQLRERLEDSVRAHLLADVSVGAFLSGGLDSAGVVGLMRRASGARLRTFSVDVTDAGFSEASEAAETARHFGTEHTTSPLSGSQVAADIESIVGALDQPTGDGINTYYAAQAARRGGVTVALSGLGGDELFGGYPSFRDTPRLARWLPAWRVLPLRARTAVIARLQRGDTRRRKLADVLQHAGSLHDVGSLQRRVLTESATRGLLTEESVARLGPRIPHHPELARLRADLNGSSPFEVVSAWELRTYMSDVLLRDSDVMSMRHSLELRVPLVDRPLIEWVWRQPAGLKADPRQPKSALAEALHDLLPPGLPERRKRGFSFPFDAWMRHELRPFLDDTFSRESVTRSGILEPDAVERLWRGFGQGHDPREWSRVWSVAVLIAFLNRRRPSSVPSGAATARTGGTPPIAPAPPTSLRIRSSRTLLLAPEIFASEGGIPRILQTYLKALCEITGPAGAVRLVALNDGAVDSRDLRRTASDRLEEWTVCGRNKPRFVRQVLRLSRGCDEIICGHVFLLPVAWVARQLNPRLRYHLVAHGIEVWRPFSLAERMAIRGAARILCVSDYTRQELLKHCPLPEGRAVVLHNALDASFPIEAGRPLTACEPVILTVTRLTYADRYKGVQHLIEALPAIRAAIPNARLRIVGRGDDLPRLRRLAETLGVGTAVDFLGYVNDDALATEMSTCRLFALPSCKEGFGLVFLEAMAHSRPCLGARAGGIPEVISPETGLLADCGDISGIAAASIAALSHKWDEAVILARASSFSYPTFRSRLASVLVT